MLKEVALSNLFFRRKLGGVAMEAIVFLIVCVAMYKYMESRKLDRMTSDQRFKYELDKIKKKRR